MTISLKGIEKRLNKRFPKPYRIEKVKINGKWFYTDNQGWRIAADLYEEI
jgi:hypothetical protein